jgi:hypothetical protein
MTRSRHQWIALAIAVAALVAVPVNAARAQEQYICELTQVTGFAYDEASDKWGIARFSESDRYIISRPSDKWEIKKLGESFSAADCTEFDEYGFLSECDGFGLDFRFNKETNRFMVIHPIGYVTSDPSGDGRFTPYMGIGRCSPF